MTKAEKEQKTYELQTAICTRMERLSQTTSDIGDWKIIKIYEARLKGESDPYDYDELSEERQTVRDEINVLQEELAALEETEVSEDSSESE